VPHTGKKVKKSVHVSTHLRCGLARKGSSVHLPIVWVGKKDVGMERPSMHVLGAVREKGIGPKKRGVSPWGRKQ